MDNGLTGGESALQVALHSPETGNIVFFAEETDSIILNLEGFSLPFKATLVDTEAVYSEIDLGMIDPSDQTLDLSSFGAARDWKLLLTEVIPGDFDLDGDVDGADFLQWQRDQGNPSDLALWESNFGLPVTIVPTGTGVPEPTALALLVFGLTICASHRF